MRNSNQSGFTLTELMIAVALGMSVISSVLLGYLATYSGSISTLANSKLSQDMTTLMNVMIEDIRRAGYDATLTSDPTDNPFSELDNTALAVFDGMVPAKVGPQASGDCVVYSYDRNENGAVEATELFGFRLNVDVVEMRSGGDPDAAETCDEGSPEWNPLTDADFMTVSTLTFSLANSACLNTSEPDDDDDDLDGTKDNDPEDDCYVIAPDVDDVTVETRQLDITLEGNLTNDTFVQLSLRQFVRVRNDIVRIQ